MSTPPSAVEELARRLVAAEAARDPAAGPAGAVARTCAGLRGPLARLAGVAGFRSLLSRAVALAKADDPALAGARVGADGALDGAGAAADGGAAVVAHLLGLLVLFIGEPLTRQLIYDAWPGAAADETGGQAEGLV